MWFLFGEVSSSSGCLGWATFLLWHSLSLPYNYYAFCKQLIPISSSTKCVACIRMCTILDTSRSTIRENKDLNLPTYIAFLDAKSAFDVVSHSSLLRKLFHFGIEGPCLNIIESLHSKAETTIKEVRCQQLADFNFLFISL